jgi:hypothetical protein
MSVLDPSNPIYVTGTEEDRKRARDQWHRDRFVAQVRRSSLPELPRATLAFGRFGIVEDTTDGRLYRARRDEIGDLEYATGVVAYYLNEAGLPVLLEEPPGPQSRQALEEQQAAREARRKAPRPRPAWMR